MAIFKLNKLIVIIFLMVMMPTLLCWYLAVCPNTLQETSSPSPGEIIPGMTGISFTSWEGGRRSCLLKLQRLEFVPKKLGPFKFSDLTDLVIKDCCLQVEDVALVSSLEEIGKILLSLHRTQNPSIPSYGNSLGPRHGTAVCLSPMFLPPKLEAWSFSCCITYSSSQDVKIKANLAASCPPQHNLTLKGDVQVVSANGACLRADTMDWLVAEKKLRITGRYDFRSGNRHLRGQGGEFSLAKGKLKKLKFVRKILPTPKSLNHPNP